MDFKQKYLKYKQKYLSLKDSFVQGDSLKQKYIALKEQSSFVQSEKIKQKYIALKEQSSLIGGAFKKGDNVDQISTNRSGIILELITAYTVKVQFYDGSIKELPVSDLKKSSLQESRDVAYIKINEIDRQIAHLQRIKEKLDSSDYANESDYNYEQNEIRDIESEIMDLKEEKRRLTPRYLPLPVNTGPDPVMANRTRNKFLNKVISNLALQLRRLNLEPLRLTRDTTFAELNTTEARIKVLEDLLSITRLRGRVNRKYKDLDEHFKTFPKEYPKNAGEKEGAYFKRINPLKALRRESLDRSNAAKANLEAIDERIRNKTIQLENFIPLLPEENISINRTELDTLKASLVLIRTRLAEAERLLKIDNDIFNDLYQQFEVAEKESDLIDANPLIRVYPLPKTFKFKLTDPRILEEFNYFSHEITIID